MSGLIHTTEGSSKFWGGGIDCGEMSGKSQPEAGGQAPGRVEAMLTSDGPGGLGATLSVEVRGGPDPSLKERLTVGG